LTVVVVVVVVVVVPVRVKLSVVYSVMKIVTVESVPVVVVLVVWLTVTVVVYGLLSAKLSYTEQSNSYDINPKGTPWPRLGTLLTGAATMIVVSVMPRQEQALEYFTTPERGEAYVGTALGTSVT
jgi:hypothetical protein